MKTIQYYLISQIGMLPNTIIVIYIGKGLNEIIVSDAAIGMEFVILLTMLGLLPILFKQIFKKILR
jgi:uncharacterized membrane protein YdjX (TVP38/TMEM64 family)